MPGILFPRLGFATAEGTILRWEKEVGQEVAAGEALVEIASEKAINVVAAPGDGRLLAVYAPPGAIVPEGETLGWIGEAGESPPALNCRLLGWEADIAPPPADLDEKLGGVVELPGEPPHSLLSMEPAQQVAKQFRAFLKKQLREVAGRRMAKSWVDAPKVDLFAEIDFSAVMAHRQSEKNAGHQPPPFNVYIVQAVARAFQEFPELNCHWRDGRRVPLDGIHVGVAVALKESLLTISLKDLGGLSLREVERRYKSMIRKVVTMNLKRDELYGSSLTVTNLGEFEIFGFTPVLNPPEIFILGIGELKERPVVRDGAFSVAPLSYFCLSFDHRGVDGAPASRLLRAIKHQLEQFSDGGGG